MLFDISFSERNQSNRCGNDKKSESYADTSCGQFSGNIGSGNLCHVCVNQIIRERDRRIENLVNDHLSEHDDERDKFQKEDIGGNRTSTLTDQHAEHDKHGSECAYQKKFNPDTFASVSDKRTVNFAKASESCAKTCSYNGVKESHDDCGDDRNDYLGKINLGAGMIFGSKIFDRSV